MKNLKTAKKAIRILLAEDDEELRKLLSGALHDDGYDVTECRHGIDLVDQIFGEDEPIKAEQFDLILSDVRMPGVTGLSVLEGLAQFDGAPPVILITAFGDEKTHATAKRLGAVAMIDKPFEMEDILSQVNQALKKN